MAVMQRMGFGQGWCNLVLRCISSVHFSTPGKQFVPSRGLRQGDPLSPYLFLFVSEVFFMLISRACAQGSLVGVKLTQYGPTILHIFFADDSLLFLKADKENCIIWLLY